jgi:hypothetical protein
VDMTAGTQQSICYFGLKQFTSDGRYIFFLSSGWVVSMGLHRYDTRTKALTFVMDANDVIVLNKCKKQENRDNLVVRQHHAAAVGEAGGLHHGAAEAVALHRHLDDDGDDQRDGDRPG